MKASIFFLVLASASAAPQFEGLKNIFSALSGDDEWESVEEQAREQNVHETFQVHLWSEQGAGGSGDDCPSPEQNEEFTVYVHKFGGYAMSDSVNLREARKFAEVLKNAGEEVDTDLFYTAGYDSPMKFWNRRNEVMFLVPGNDL